MKIAIVAANIWGTVHLDMAQALCRLGHVVVVYSEDKRAPSGTHFLRINEDGIDFFVISDTRRNAWTWLLDKLTKPFLGRRFFTSLVAIARFLRVNRDSDWVLVEGDWMGFFVGLTALFLPLRWVVEIHDTLYLRIPIDYPGRPRSRWREWVKRWVLKQATGIRANSEVTCEALIQGGGRKTGSLYSRCICHGGCKLPGAMKEGALRNSARMRVPGCGAVWVLVKMNRCWWSCAGWIR